MRYILTIVLTLGMLSGCHEYTFDYVEGTSFQLGLYVPVNQSLYGLQFVNYLAGVRVKSTNSVQNISRQHSLTNSYIGVFDNGEYTNTEVK